MKLYISPGACSMAPHIVLNELGLAHTIEKVNLRVQPHVLVDTGADYTAVNPKGSVPALKLQSGELLTENAVMLQYLVDQKPDSGLLPRYGTMERYHAMEWLNFLGSDLHKSFSPFWNPTFSDDAKKIFKQNLDRCLSYLENHLGKNDYLAGANYTVADAYLFVLLSWSSTLKLDMTPYPSLKKFQDRVGARPAVVKTLKAEGLI